MWSGSSRHGRNFKICTRRTEAAIITDGSEGIVEIFLNSQINGNRSSHYLYRNESAPINLMIAPGGPHALLLAELM